MKCNPLSFIMVLLKISRARCAHVGHSDNGAARRFEPSTPFCGPRHWVKGPALVRTCVITSCVVLFSLGEVLTTTASACTTAVVSGRVTNDGRPLLWKNRDFSQKHNEVIRLTGGTYNAIGVVNAGSRTSVWMGTNDAGFCIENSLSLDLNSKTTTKGPGNGSLMRRALESCATIDDFIKLLNETEKTGRVTCGNFGVIDANGGAAMFEVSRTGHTMFDANDPNTAPHGYIVRANFSTTGQKLPPLPTPSQLAGISSAGRYLRACSLLDSQTDAKISAEFLIRNCARDLAGPDGTCYSGTVNSTEPDLPTEIPTAETISRFTTVSAAVFHGVKDGEDASLTTMFVFLGDPKFSIAVPCWAAVSEIPDALQDKSGGEIGEVALTLREWGFDSSEDKTLDTTNLQGIWQDVWNVEHQVLLDARAIKDASSKADVAAKVLAEFSHHTAALAMKTMQQELIQVKNAALSLNAPAAPTFADRPSTNEPHQPALTIE